MPNTAIEGLLSLLPREDREIATTALLGGTLIIAKSLYPFLPRNEIKGAWIHQNSIIAVFPIQQTNQQTIMSEEEKTVTLVSLDDHRYTLPVEAAALSEMVSNALGLGDDADGDDDDDEDEENQDTTPKSVDLLKVTSRCLEKVVEFMKHHQQEKMNEIPMPLPGNNFDEVSVIFLLSVCQVVMSGIRKDPIRYYGLQEPTAKDYVSGRRFTAAVVSQQTM